MPMTVCQPGYETPHIPTRPLFFGMFFSAHSIVSYVSLLSSTSLGVRFTGLNGRMTSNSPSDRNFPRTS